MICIKMRYLANKALYTPNYRAVLKYIQYKDLNSGVASLSKVLVLLLKQAGEGYFNVSLNLGSLDFKYTLLLSRRTKNSEGRTHRDKRALRSLVFDTLSPWWWKY